MVCCRERSYNLDEPTKPLQQSYCRFWTTSMNIEVWEQVTAIAVTIGLVAGNFFLFTPWRNGHDPRAGDLGRSQDQSLLK